MLLVLFPSLKYDKIKMNSPTPFFRLLYPVRGICDFVLHTGLHLDHVISIFPDSFKWQEKSKIKQSAKVSSITLILILLVFFQPLTYKSYIIDIVQMCITSLKPVNSLPLADCRFLSSTSCLVHIGSANICHLQARTC